MTARTLPITPRGGLSLVHQPTSRHTVQNATTPAARLPLLRRRLAAWWQRLDGPQLGWAQERLLQQERIDAEAYAWVLRSFR